MFMKMKGPLFYCLLSLWGISLEVQSNCISYYVTDGANQKKYAAEIEYFSTDISHPIKHKGNVAEKVLNKIDTMAKAKGSIWTADELWYLVWLGMDSELYCNPNTYSFDEILENLVHENTFDYALLRVLNSSDKELKSRVNLIPTKDILSLAYKLQHRSIAFIAQFPEKIDARDPKKGTDFTGRFEYFLHPENHRVYMRLRESSYSENYPALVGGRISYKSPADKMGMRQEWILHDRTGGPTRLNIKAKEYLTEMAVASEALMVVSNLGRMYLYKPFPYLRKSIDVNKKTEWEYLLGAPFIQKLYMPLDKKVWALSNSLVEKGERVTTDILHPDDINYYFTDAAGQNIAFGLTLTAFVLSEDGHTIRYWDTGLPVSYSRAVLTPEHGAFTAEGMSAASSTIAVIGYSSKDGKLELYTRMFDYEINGTCIGLYFSYNLAACKQLAELAVNEGRTQTLTEAIRCLPIGAWQKHELPTAAKITSGLSIISKGKGDQNRELRLEGENEAGEKGYYSKTFMGGREDWQFTANKSLEFSGKILPLIEENYVSSGIDLNYNGEIEVKALHQNLKIRLEEFHPYQAPDQASHVKIMLNEEEFITMQLHTNDAWYLATQSTFFPERVGDKIIKVLLGTLTIEDEELSRIKSLDKDNELRKLWEQFLVPYVVTQEKLTEEDIQRYISEKPGHFYKALDNNLKDGAYYKLISKTNLFTLEVSAGKVKMYTRNFKRISKDYLDLEFMPKFNVTFSLDKKDEKNKSNLVNSLSLRKFKFTNIVNSKNYSLDVNEREDSLILEEKLKRNKLLLAYMKQDRTFQLTQTLFWGTGATLTRGVLGGLNILIITNHLYKMHGSLHAISATLPKITPAYSHAYFRELRKLPAYLKSKDRKKALKILEERIKDLETALENSLSSQSN